MRTLLFLSLAATFILIACDSSDTFIIKGSFALKDPTPLTLFLLEENSSSLIDSTHTTEKVFELSGKTDHPGIYRLNFFNDQSIYLIIFPGDKIRLSIDNSMSEISYYVENSPESKRVKELTDQQAITLRKIDQLSKAWEEYRADSSKRKIIDSTYMAIMRNQQEYTREFIYAKPASLANIMAIYQNFGRRNQTLFDPYDDFDLYRFVDSNLIALYPYSAPVIALNQEVNEIKEQINQRKYIRKIVEAGRPLPEFSYPALSGDTINITKKHNKPVLLIFWASWNPYSVNELLTAENTVISSEKATIISISLDSDQKKLEQFLEDNPITLPVVCDYQYWNSELVARYAVKQIPSTLLCDAQGLIVAKDMFGEELYDKLNSLIQ